METGTSVHLAAAANRDTDPSEEWGYYGANGEQDRRVLKKPRILTVGLEAGAATALIPAKAKAKAKVAPALDRAGRIPGDIRS